MPPYYSPKLKEARLSILQAPPDFSFEYGMLEEFGRLTDLVGKFDPDVIVHLAAQAGFRNSMGERRSIVASNLIGSHEVLEAARACKYKQLMRASTSSGHGADT